MNELITELPEEEEEDGFLAVVKRDCSGQPPPELDRFIALDNRLRASTTFTEALDILEQANLTEEEYNYVNSSLFDGLRFVIAGRLLAREREEREKNHWHTRLVGGVSVVGLSLDSPTMRLVCDQVAVTRLVVRSGKTAAAKFLMRRGINMAHVTDVAVEALLSDNPRMLELVWPRVAFNDVYNKRVDCLTHGRFGVSLENVRNVCACNAFVNRKMKSFRWLLENGHVPNPGRAIERAISEIRDYDRNAYVDNYESEITLAMELGLKFTCNLRCSPECYERLLRHGVRHGTWHGCDLVDRQVLRQIVAMGFVPTPKDLEHHLDKMSRCAFAFDKTGYRQTVMELLRLGTPISDEAVVSVIGQEDFWLLDAMVVDHGYDPRNIMPALERLQPGCKIPWILHVQVQGLIDKREKDVAAVAVAVVGQKRARDTDSVA
jgi:hypothetical protein